MAAVLTVAIIGLDGLPAAAEQGASPTETAAQIVETPPAELSGWARNLAEDYEEKCGRPLDPALIAGMNKREAEAEIEPLIEACEEAGED